MLTFDLDVPKNCAACFEISAGSRRRFPDEQRGPEAHLKCFPIARAGILLPTA